MPFPELPPGLAVFLDLIDFAVLFAHETVQGFFETLHGHTLAGGPQPFRSLANEVDGPFYFPICQGLHVTGEGFWIGEASHAWVSFCSRPRNIVAAKLT